MLELWRVKKQSGKQDMITKEMYVFWLLTQETFEVQQFSRICAYDIKTLIVLRRGKMKPFLPFTILSNRAIY